MVINAGPEDSVPYQWLEDPWEKEHTVGTVTTVDSLEELENTIDLAIHPAFGGQDTDEIPHTITYMDIDTKVMSESAFRKAFQTNISVTVEHTPEDSVKITIQANNTLTRASGRTVKKLVEGCLGCIS